MEDRLRNGKEEANRALETASRMIDVDLRKNQIPTEIKLKFQEFPEKLEDIEGEIHVRNFSNLIFLTCAIEMEGF